MALSDLTSPTAIKPAIQECDRLDLQGFGVHRRSIGYANAAGAERVVSIVGVDEVDLNRNHISWVSPLGRALMKSAAGDSVVLQAPGGTEYLTLLEVCYERISVEPFREPPGSEASAKGLPRRR